MSKIRSTSIVFLTFSILFILLPNFNTVEAADNCQTYATDPTVIPEDIAQIQIIFTNITDSRYRLRSRAGLKDVYEQDSTLREIDAFGGILTQTVTQADGKLTWGIHEATLERWNSTANRWEDYCGFIKYKVGYVFEDCALSTRPDNPRDNEQFTVDIRRAPKGSYDLLLDYSSDKNPRGDIVGNISIDSNGEGTLGSNLGPISPAVITLQLFSSKYGAYGGFFCKRKINVGPAVGASPRPIPSLTPSPVPRPPKPIVGLVKTCEGEGIQTAIGCIHTSPIEFTKDFLRFAIGIAGGLAFLMMLLGAFQMLTSAGNPEALSAGRERLTSAIIGLLFVIFSVLLLQIIGLGILNIRGFGP